MNEILLLDQWLHRWAAGVNNDKGLLNVFGLESNEKGIFRWKTQQE